MKRTVKIIAISLAALFLGTLLILAVGYLILLNIDPNKDRPERIEHPNGFVRAVGTNLYDGDGRILQLKGVNLGNWFIQENWMAVSSVGDFETGVYTKERGYAAMRRNPNLDEEKIKSLYELYMDTYITERDIAEIASLGMNAVRVNFSYLDLTTDGRTLRENGFYYLDKVISLCEKYDLYVVLDLHGAIGSQNQDQHSGNDASHDLYGNPENEAKTVFLWETIAARYKDNRTVAGYDLLNETREAPGKYTAKVNFDFYDVLYRAIRKVDPHHLIFIECFTFPTHGASIQGYGWENICMQYHIYNLTPLSQRTCLGFYKALHNLMGYHAPVYIGEWNAFEKRSEWEDSLAFFDELGWSFSSWTYKTNKYFYSRGEMNSGTNNWGLYELDMPPVDLSTATYEEIAKVYASVGTENAQKSMVYDVYASYFKK